MLAEATTINIQISWPAAAVIVGIITTAVGAYIYLNRRVDLHLRDNDRHLTGDRYVNEDICRITRESIKNDQNEIRKYISDVNKNVQKLIDHLIR